MQDGIKNFKVDAPHQELETNAVYQCFDLNHEALSEWLFARLGSTRDVPNSKGE